MTDYNELDRTERDDRTWFERNPDREWRCRRARSCEYHGMPPPGFDVFTIVDGYAAGHRSDPRAFGAPITFDPDRTDQQIREILRALAIDPHAMLTQEI